jgi:hypothetical protein
MRSISRRRKWKLRREKYFWHCFHDVMYIYIYIYIFFFFFRMNICVPESYCWVLRRKYRAVLPIDCVTHGSAEPMLQEFMLRLSRFRTRSCYQCCVMDKKVSCCFLSDRFPINMLRSGYWCDIMLKFCHGGSGRRREYAVSTHLFIVISSNSACLLVLELSPARCFNGTKIHPRL